VLARNLAWPIRRGEEFFAFLTYLPVSLLFLSVILRKQSLTPTVSFVIGLGFWTFLQAAGIAYMRGAGYGLQIESRYTDILVLGCIANAAASCVITEKRLFSIPRWFASTWCAVCVIGLINCGFYSFFHQLPEIKFRREQQIVNVRAYMGTGDIQHLKDKPFLHVPFPKAEILAGILSDPTLRRILPCSLTKEPASSVPYKVVQKLSGSAELIFLLGILTPLVLSFGIVQLL